MSRPHLAVLLRWGTETSGRVPTRSRYMRRSLIGRQNRHFRATGIKTNTVPARNLWTTVKTFNEEHYLCSIHMQKKDKPAHSVLVKASTLLKHIKSVKPDSDKSQQILHLVF